jgi:hypothetical protein
MCVWLTIINVAHLHWLATKKRSRLCHHIWKTIEELAKKQELFQPPYPECTLNVHNGYTTSEFRSFIFMKLLGCDNNANICRPGHSEGKINHWVTSDIILLENPVKSKNFSNHKSPPLLWRIQQVGSGHLFLLNFQDFILAPTRAG